MSNARMNPEEIHAHISSLSRQPFRELASRILEHGPSDEAIGSLAERNPDRYGQLLAIVARLGGYTEKLEVEGTLTHKIQDLSDSALLARLAALEGVLDTQSSGIPDK